ncbi:hypothetical protein ACTXT7_000681 [Hymenolepis weldensis]
MLIHERYRLQTDSEIVLLQFKELRCVGETYTSAKSEVTRLMATPRNRNGQPELLVLVKKRQTGFMMSIHYQGASYCNSNSEGNDDIKLNPSVRDSVKVTNLKHFMESSMGKVVPARFASEPAVPEQLLVPKSCVTTRQIKYSVLNDRRKIIVLLLPTELIHRPFLVNATKLELNPCSLAILSD